MMEVFLQHTDDRFEVSDTFGYIGFIKFDENTWTCFPEQPIRDIDPKIVSEVDGILRFLNSKQ